MTHRTPRNGFTLVEALVSLVVLGLFSMLVMEGVGSGRAIAKAIEGRARAGETLQAAQSLLRSRLSQMAPVVAFGGSRPEVAFTGETAQIEFVGPPADADRPAALVSQRLWLTGSGELMLGREDAFAGDIDEPYRRDVILRDVTRLEIDYYGRNFRGDVGWHDRWVARSELPRLVRVRLQRRDEPAGNWPDLIVRPMTTIDRQCLIDARTGGCRGRT